MEYHNTTPIKGENTMKKALALLLLFTMLVMTLCACGGANPPAVSDASEELSSEEATSAEVSSEDSVSPIEESSGTSQIGTSSKEASKVETSKAANNTTEWTPRPKTPTTLSAERAKKIKEDYLAWQTKDSQYIKENYTAEDVDIQNYYGSYSGSELLKISFKDTNSPAGFPSEMIIAGFSLSPGTLHYSRLYVNGVFVTIKDAYDTGKITKQDVCDMQLIK
jgi:hypothetical protein